MKKKLVTGKNKVKSAFAKLLTVAAGALAYVGLLPANAYAATKQIKVNTNLDFEEAAGKVLGFIFTVMTFVGVGVAIFGIYQLVMCFVQDRPEDKAKGITFILVGLAAAGIGGIMNAIGLTS